MKKLGFYFISALITASLFFAGCTKDDAPDINNGSILPETFAVDIPNAISHEGGKKSPA